MITIIAAAQNDRGIGMRGNLPWRIPEDLARFKEVTTGHPVVMGRKTFESIGRPLPNRTNIVLTSDANWSADGVLAVHDFASALASAQSAPGGDDVFIIGGSGVYASALELADRLLLTQVDAKEPCDAFFPAFESQFPIEKSIEHHTSVSGVHFSFAEYRK